MLGQIMMDLGTTQHANAGQPEIFGQPTTDFFGMQDIPRSREMALTEQESPPIHIAREKTSGQILDEVFRDHADAWRKLADL